MTRLKRVRPDLCPMQDTQNANAIRKDGIGGDVGRSGDHQFPRPRYPTGPSALRKLEQLTDTQLNFRVDANGSGRIFLLDEVEDRQTVSNCQC